MTRTARVAVAVNPTAGRGAGAAAGRVTVQVLQQAGVDTDLLVADSAEALLALVRARRGSGSQTSEVDAVVAVGGDGMVHLAAQAVAGTSTPLGIVASGTGNDIATAAGLPVGDVEAAAQRVAQALLDGDVTAVDALHCTGTWGSRWVLGAVAGGFDAVVNERANRMRWPSGTLRYVLATARELPVFRARPYRISVDGQDQDTAAMLVVVANATSYGGGMKVCPAARIDDGLLDLLVLRPLSRPAFVRTFPRVFRGTHVSHPAVSLTRATRVEFDAPGIVAYADGERLGPLPLDCHVVGGSVRLLGARVGSVTV